MCRTYVIILHVGLGSLISRIFPIIHVEITWTGLISLIFLGKEIANLGAK